MSKSPITDFVKHHYRHFNAATVIDAADAYAKVLDNGGKMMVTLAGAMSSGELGLSLAEMIRQDKVQIISTTGANLEEDIFNLVAHDHYVRVPHYRDLTPAQEQELLDRKLNRVTDTCIPEDEAMRVIDELTVSYWKAFEKAGERKFPHEILYAMIRDWMAKPEKDRPFQIDPKDSWMIAACEKNLPIVVPGWEDSTLGNTLVANVFKGQVDSLSVCKSGLEYMKFLVEWYLKERKSSEIGFFQIGGGIAGDFPICVVPLINQDLKKDPRYESAALWSYFCQISDSTTSYGSYSGAVPNEKITWGKLGPETPKFIIESDATIVAPLIFAQLLGW